MRGYVLGEIQNSFSEKNGRIFTDTADEDLHLFVCELEKKVGQLCHAYLIRDTAENPEIKLAFIENNGSENGSSEDGGYELLYSFCVKK